MAGPHAAGRPFHDRSNRPNGSIIGFSEKPVVTLGIHIFPCVAEEPFNVAAFVVVVALHPPPAAPRRAGTTGPVPHLINGSRAHLPRTRRKRHCSRDNDHHDCSSFEHVSPFEEAPTNSANNVENGALRQRSIAEKRDYDTIALLYNGSAEVIVSKVRECVAHIPIERLTLPGSIRITV
jgi:hypothetical protein